MRPLSVSRRPRSSSARSRTTVLATERARPKTRPWPRVQPQARARPMPMAVAAVICTTAPGRAMERTAIRSLKEKCSPTPNISRMTPISASWPVRLLSPTKPGVSGADEDARDQVADQRRQPEALRDHPADEGEGQPEGDDGDPVRSRAAQGLHLRGAMRFGRSEPSRLANAIQPSSGRTAVRIAVSDRRVPSGRCETTAAAPRWSGGVRSRDRAAGAARVSNRGHRAGIRRAVAGRGGSGQDDRPGPGTRGFTAAATGRRRRPRHMRMCPVVPATGGAAAACPARGSRAGPRRRRDAAGRRGCRRVAGLRQGRRWT